MLRKFLNNMVDIYIENEFKIRVSNYNCIELYKYWYKEYINVINIVMVVSLPLAPNLSDDGIFDDIKDGRSEYAKDFERIVDEWINKQKINKINKIMDSLLE